jgi:hypothetical protein
MQAAAEVEALKNSALVTGDDAGSSSNGSRSACSDDASLYKAMLIEFQVQQATLSREFQVQ